MSTKTNTSTSNQYNANGMAAYNSLIPSFASTTSALMNSPLNNSFFQNQLAQSQSSASQVNQRNIANTGNNLRTGGGILGGGAGGFQTASLNNAMLSNSTNSSNAFNSSLNGALQNRNFALQSAEGFNPLQTGANTTQTKSGLGTWLPQVAGMGLQAAMPGIGGLLGGGTFSSGYTNGAANLSQTQAMANMPNPFTTTTPNAGWVS